VDKEVDQMVAEYIEPSEIVIEGEGEIGEDPNGVGIGISDQLFQPVEGKNLDLNIWVVEDIGPVIELERNVESVGVGYEGYNHHQADGEEVF
jgi:hypothetical protein